MAKLTINTHTPSQPHFNSDMLKIGEMMQTDGGSILLKVYDVVVDLGNPEMTFDAKSTITGRKLLQGESITLTQK